MDRKASYLVPAACICLAVATLAVYSRALHNPFMRVDDQYYVTENPQVQAGLSWQTVVWAFTATAAENWHPLTWLSHALDCEVYGLNPAGHHATNILLHTINVVLLFLLLLRATGSKGRSLLVGALFALHPLNGESVAWIAERKNVLSTLLFLLTLTAYGWYARQPDGKRYFAVVVLFALGLAAKPMVITLPFVMLLLDFWPLERIQAERVESSSAAKARNRKKRPQSLPSDKVVPVPPAPLARLILEKLPLLVLCVGSAAITIVAQRTHAIRTFEFYPLAGRIENAIYCYAAYVWKMFWPARLAFYYPYPWGGRAAWQVELALLFLLAVSAVVWRLRARKYLVTGWLWYLGTLVPVIGLVQVGDQAMADRYTYIPAIGIFGMIVWSAADLADARSVGLRWRAIVTAVVLAVLSVLTWRQIGFWHSDYDLWSHTVQVTKNNVIAEETLSKGLMQAGRPQEALVGFQDASRLYPRDPFRHQNVALALLQSGRLTDAIAEYEATIQWSTDAETRARSYEKIATIYGMLGNYSEVGENYRRALAASPALGPAMLHRISQYAANSPSGPHYVQLGILQQELGKFPEARAAYQEALRLEPGLSAAKALLDALGKG